MKKLSFLLVLAVLMVGLMAGAAFATRYDSTYADFASSPHGQYSTATTKCSACHAVHSPGDLAVTAAADKDTDAERDANIGSSEALLRGTIADACTYCHITGPFAIQKVYASAEANYNGAPTGRAHNGGGAALTDTNVNCTNCHQVHGAATQMASWDGVDTVDDAYLYSKILKEQIAYDSDTAAFATNAGPGINDANMTKWCTGCHVYYEAGHNSNSHIMNTAASGGVGDLFDNPSANYTGRVAWSDSTDCRSCHQDGDTNGTDGTNDYPHFTNGYRFLSAGNAANDAAIGPASTPAAGTPVNDGACLICHANYNGLTSTTDGAGFSF